ncbi:MAG: orotate phosphoribosyltransferase [Pseudomonadota bacterium]
MLQFGDFTLKSGRRSPYFFNFGKLTSGTALRTLAAGYRAVLEQADLIPNVVFGPAYKGIPLAVAVAMDWAAAGRAVGITYNRKEPKAHGEGGQLVGAALAGQRVALLDDVLTAGTALREAAQLIKAEGGVLQSVVITMDRRERVRPEPSAPSAVQALEDELGVPVRSLLRLEDVLAYLQSTGTGEPNADHGRWHDQLVNYQAEYCVRT